MMVHLSVPVPKKLKRWLQEQATREGRTLADYVRKALLSWQEMNAKGDSK